MIPLILLVTAAYLARFPVPAPPPAPPAPIPATVPARAARPVDVRTVAAVWALGVTVVGAWPMAAAAASRSADPVLARALDGSAAIVDFAAPGFSLTSEDGRAVSLASLRGKTVLLTFLDPVCTSDCPLIAQEFRQADAMLGARSTHVELVAIAANPVYHSARYARAFDRQEGLAALANWMFLSGPLPALRRAWHDYSFPVTMTPAGGMVAHGDVAYVIDPAGRVRTELNFNPGPGTSATRSSFAAELASAADAASAAGGALTPP
jgi:cytochrome oxidase Cu insertion factor (SCO1/SenC/PrrC family)